MTSFASMPFKTVSIAATALVATPAMADSMTVDLQLPKLRVAEYHDPYVAVWIEDASGKAVKTLDVWYQLRGREDGRKWLPDLRGWWRKAGRSMDMPADGISGPTQAPGTHRINYSEGAAPLGKLAAGSYTLRVEAVREVGGRESLSIPFSWPVANASTATAQGKRELGTVKLFLKP